jgi:hypothetical protein
MAREGRIMKINKHKMLRNEKGQALVLVLILLLIGSLILTPLLAFMGTGLKAGMTHEEKMDELYAADSGISDGFWQIKRDQMDTRFASYTPPYDPYDYYQYSSDNWNYTLGEIVNDHNVNVTIKNMWIPKNLTTLNKADARTIIEGSAGNPPKLIVAGVVVNVPTGSTPGIYRIKIAYYPTVGENLTISTLGIWLPPGFTYADSCTLDAVGQPYYSVPATSSHCSGQAVVWSFSSVPFSSFPNLSVSSPRESTISFQFNGAQGKRPAAVAWINTNLDLGGGYTYTWDGDKKVYQITSTAGSTTIDAYTVKVALRQMASAVAGDYIAIGNSILVDTTPPLDGQYRNTLLSSSNATVSSLSTDAYVELAYLYWSGWYETSTGGSQTRVPTADGDTSGTWNVTQTQTRVPTGDSDISGTWNNAPRWDDVDETTADDTDYMTGTTDAGGYMLFTFDAFNVPAGATINNLTIFIRAGDETSGGNNIREYIKVNSSYYQGSASHNPGTTPTSYSYSWTTNPNTGSAWTVNDINGTGGNPLQRIGVYSTDLNPDMRVTQVYAQVSYTITTDRYAGIDETTADDGDFMTGTTDGGGYALFAFPAFSIPVGSPINYLRIYYRAIDASSGNNNIRAAIKVGSTVYNTTDSGNNPGSSFNTYYYDFSTNPKTGLAWTINDINGFGANALQQFGVSSTDLNPDIQVSMVYAVVNYQALVADTTATFRINYLDINGVPKVSSQTLTADPTNGMDRVQTMLNEAGPDYSYSCRKDVTDLVRSYSRGANPSGTPPVNGNGNAAYTVSDVGATANANDEWAYAGWSLVIIYSSSNTTGHQLYLYDDFVYSRMDRNVDFDSDGNPGGTISGFFVPEPIRDPYTGQISENVSAKLTCFVGEGDDIWPGDYIAIKRLDNTMFTKLWDGTTTSGNSQASPNNVWNSKSLGVNADGVDVDTFYVYWGNPVSSGVLQPGDTSIKIDMYTQTDSWNLVYIILSFRSATTTGGTSTYLIIQ